MLQARSPLFFFVLAAAFAGGAVAVLWNAFGESPGLAWTAALLAAVVLAIAILEVRMYLGWEPSFLQRRLLGAVVESRRRHPTRPGYEVLTVVLPGQRPLSFEAEPGELAGLESGDACHLEAVGRYVASVSVLHGAAAQRAVEAVQQAGAARWRHPRVWIDVGSSAHLLAIAVIWAAPFVLGAMAGGGVALLGETSPLLGAGLITLSLLGLGLLANLWRVGWNPLEVSDTIGRLLDDDQINRRWRS